MLRVATFNVNGIRAARRRGFDDWIARREPDVVALQEVRCPVAALPPGWHGAYHAAYDAGELAGRNGVAVLLREAPAAVRGWGGEVLVAAPGEEGIQVPVPPAPLARALRPHALHGRYLEVDLADRPLTVASLYVPKGGLPAELQRPGRMREAPDGGARYHRKMGFLDGFTRQVTAARRAAKARGRDYLLMGDLNVAHTPADVAYWRRNLNSEGFLPSERAWMDTLVGPRRLRDVVRELHPEADGPYSWWSWMGRTFVEDKGWRIDYHLATPGLARTAVAGWVDRDEHVNARIADHAPVVVDYDI